MKRASKEERTKTLRCFHTYRFRSLDALVQPLEAIHTATLRYQKEEKVDPNKKMASPSENLFYWIDIVGTPPSDVIQQSIEAFGAPLHLHPRTMEKMCRTVQLAAEEALHPSSSDPFEKEKASVVDESADLDPSTVDTVEVQPFIASPEPPATPFYLDMQLGALSLPTRLEGTAHSSHQAATPATPRKASVVEPPVVLTEPRWNGEESSPIEREPYAPETTHHADPAVVEAAPPPPPRPSRRKRRLGRALVLAEDEASAGRAGKPRLCPVLVLLFAQGCLTWCPSIQPSASNSRALLRWGKMKSAVRRSLASPPPGATSGPSSFAASPSSQAFLLQFLLPAVLYAFLPDTASLLGEVDRLDDMLPMIEPDVESDQVDALRRVLGLRHRITLYRQLLLKKVQLLESLRSRAVQTYTPFLHRRGVGDQAIATVLPTTGEGTVGPTAVGGTAVVDVDELMSPVFAPRAGSFSGWEKNGDSQSPVEVPRRSFFSPTTANRSLGRVDGRNNGKGALEAMDTDPYTSLIRLLDAVLVKLNSARSILGNTTIIYTTSVTNQNNFSSNDTDDFSVWLNFIAVIVIPLNLLASHWGMNCYVPGQGAEDSLFTFTILVSFMGLMILVGMIYPSYAYITGKLHLIT